MIKNTFFLLFSQNFQVKCEIFKLLPQIRKQFQHMLDKTEILIIYSKRPLIASAQIKLSKNLSLFFIILLLSCTL